MNPKARFHTTQAQIPAGSHALDLTDPRRALPDPQPGFAWELVTAQISEGKWSDLHTLTTLWREVEK